MTRQMMFRMFKRWQHLERNKDGAIKFTKSGAHIDYKATKNFYSEDKSLPKSHNAVIAGTGIVGFYYLIFLREDADADGGKELLKPAHEVIPELAIPLLQSAIAENKRFGANTKKLEEKLAELRKDEVKYGGHKKKLVEN